MLNDLQRRIDKLRASADTAAGNVRTLYAGFLGFALYLVTTVGATTDLQLVRSAPVRLPIVNVELPLFGFYWVAPTLFLLFHFNLLIQACLLANKLHRLDREIARLPDEAAKRDERVKLHAFAFSQMLIGEHRGLLRRLLPLVVWTSFVLIPVIVLLFVQIRFLPYHDNLTTWWHRALVVVDLLLIWLLWTAAIDPAGRVPRRLSAMLRLWKRRLEQRSGVRAILGHGLRPLIRVGFWRRLAAALFHAPGTAFRLMTGRLHRTRSLRRLHQISVAALVIAFFIGTIPSEFLAAPIDRLIGPWRSLPLVKRNLVVREVNFVSAWPTAAQIEDIGAAAAWRNFGGAINLQGRDLRYADLSASTLTRADLTGTDLAGANLSTADLSGATLLDADLRNAALWSASLQGAHLGQADLVGANLLGADLQGADITGADLTAASLIGSDLRGANLRQARLDRADLGDARLQGALLGKAILLDAKLGKADFRGADLEGADLSGADLRETDFRGADFRGATFGPSPSDRDAGPETAFWHLADLRGVEVASSLPAAREPHRENGGAAAFYTAWMATDLLLVDDDLNWGDLGRSEQPTRHGADQNLFDQELADFLADLACNGDGPAALLHNIASRIEDDDRPLARHLSIALSARCEAAIGALPRWLRDMIDRRSGAHAPSQTGRFGSKWFRSPFHTSG